MLDEGGHQGTPHHLFSSSVDLKLFKNQKPKRKEAHTLETAHALESGVSTSGLFALGQGTRLSQPQFPSVGNKPDNKAVPSP